MDNVGNSVHSVDKFFCWIFGEFPTTSPTGWLFSRSSGITLVPFPFFHTEVPMFPSPSAPDAFALFAQCLQKVPDPRSKQGTSHPCSTLLAIVLLGLLAKVSTPAEIARWTKRHFSKLSKVLRFGRIKGELKSPCDNTFTRVLKNSHSLICNMLLPTLSTLFSKTRHSLLLSMVKSPNR